MANLSSPRFEGSIRLQDDRKLGFAEFGPINGRPLLWFHGTPGARRQIAPEARRLANDQGVRIISVERPGIGLSTPHLYNTLSEFAADIEQLCDALSVKYFGVAGLSGGGPYALACAHRMPERVAAAAILGGVAPSVGSDAAEGWSSTAMRMASPVFRRTHKPLGRMMRSLIRVLEPFADQAIDLFASTMPPGDQRIFADPELRLMFQEDLILGSRSNMRAFLLDVVLFGRTWGFPLSDIQVPVHLLYGDADVIVPVEHGHHMAERIPSSTLNIRSGEGHLGGLGASQEILDAIIECWPQSKARTKPSKKSSQRSLLSAQGN